MGWGLSIIDESEIDKIQDRKLMELVSPLRGMKEKNVR